MGLVPPGSKAGDMVCLIYGAQTPYILRRDNDEHDVDGTHSTPTCTVVGECYVHGMMDGEMMASGERTEHFVIQ